MVSGHEALLFVAPLEQGEVDNPKALEGVLVAQSKSVAHLQSQGAKLGARLVGLVATENQHQVAVLGLGFLFQLGPYLGCIEFVNRRLDGTIGIELDVNQALGAHLGTLHEVGQLVELLAGIVGATRDHDTADIFGLVEYGERSSAFQHIHQLNELHTETQVGLIGAKAAHGLVPGHSLQLGQFYATNLLEQMACEVFEDFKHVLLVSKRHLAVNLRKLRLTVGTQVFVAEALGNLEVAIETANHQQLLQSLR